MSSPEISTRDRILIATAKLLEASEGKGVRMSDIAKAAGISRQALYLHFETRTELLIETTYYLDRLYGSDERLKASRQAKTGIERLDAFITAWGGYIPEIYGVARPIIAMGAADEAAAEAWNKRMQDMREGCEAAIVALERDGMLRRENSVRMATDLLWALLSVGNWERLRFDCGWSQEQFISRLKQSAKRLFVAG